AVEARLAADRHLHEDVVGRRPRKDERLERGLASAAVAGALQVAEVVERSAVAEDDLSLRRGRQLPGDLRVEDPRLGRERGVAVDRERALARHLAHELDGDVALLQRPGEVVAERGLPDAVRPDEGDLHLRGMVFRAVGFRSLTRRLFLVLAL